MVVSINSGLAQSILKGSGLECSALAMALTPIIADKLDTVIKRLYANGAPKVVAGEHGICSHEFDVKRFW